MMDERGVEHEAYSKEAPSKLPVVHSSDNHEDKDPCGKLHSSRKQNDRNKNRDTREGTFGSMAVNTVGPGERRRMHE